MVNGVSGYNQSANGFYRAAAGMAIVHRNDVENMVRFVNGQPMQAYRDPSVMSTVKSTIPMALIFGGFQSIGPLKANKWNVKNTINGVNAASPYKTRGQAIAAGKDRVIAEYGNFFKKNVAVAPERKFIGRMFDKIPGYKALRATGFGQAMGKSGAGWMAVMEGATEIFTQVVPAFKEGGFGSGMKQIGKSAAKVGVSALGWVAGDAVGKGLGAAIGTAICPGIGTAIGGFLGGFLGGMVGSAIAGKGVKSVLGKGEAEKMQDKKMAEVAQQIEADPNTKIALAQQALAQADEVLAQDPQNKDALTAKASAEKVIAEAQAAQTQEAPAEAQTPQNGHNPSFGGSLGFEVPSVPGFDGYNYDMNNFREGLSTASMAYVAPQQNMFASQVMPQVIPQVVPQVQPQ